MNMLLQAQNVCINNSGPRDEDLLEYTNQLREGILEAYSGIIQGLNDSGKASLLLPFLPGIVVFLEDIAQDSEKDTNVLRNAVGVVGDIAHTIGAQQAQISGRPALQMLLQTGLSSDDKSTCEVATWARGVMA